jgi:S1-C subfamily serine protease
MSVAHDLAVLELTNDVQFMNHINILQDGLSSSHTKSFKTVSSFGFPQTDVLTRLQGVYLTRSYPETKNLESDAIYLRGYHHGISGGPVFDDNGSFLGLNSLKSAKLNEGLISCTGTPVLALIVPSRIVKRFVEDSVNYSGSNLQPLYKHNILGMVKADIPQYTLASP